MVYRENVYCIDSIVFPFMNKHKKVSAMENPFQELKRRKMFITAAAERNCVS